MLTDASESSLRVHGVHVGWSEIRPSHELGELSTRAQADGAEFGEKDRIGSHGADALAQRLVKAADQRRDPHDGHDADDDAEDRQTRANLLLDQGVDRHGDDLLEQSTA